ncbi:MAG: hypothetical protein Q8L61_05980 [Hyphomicrobium sp.]|nr:hypothetical protein [Hyphomicrobium sp.]
MQLMEAPARQVHIFRAGRMIENCKLAPDLIDVTSIDTANLALQPKAPQRIRAKAFDHGFAALD